MEDKYLTFLFAILVLVPIGIYVARGNRRILDIVFCALVFGTTHPESLFGLPTDINFLSREWYRGSTRGIEISYLDLLALILLFASISVRTRERIGYIKPASYGLMKVYLGWAALTVFFVSEPKLFGTFELTKILRAMLVFLAVYAYVRSSREVRLFLYTLIAIVFYESAIALFHRYGLGIHRVSGTLGHPNSLSMYCLQIFPFMVSIPFAYDASPRMRKLCVFASVLIAGVVVLTISRTGFATLAILTALALGLNIRNRWTPRNIGIVLVGIAVGLTMTVKAWDSLTSRFSNFTIANEYMSDEGDRGSYFRKGWPALQANPVFGIGLNNWSYWISNRYAEEAGYQSNKYPSVDMAPNVGNQEPPAHNLYLITAVELGWIGLILMLSLFIRWFQISLTGWKRGNGGLLDRVRLASALSLCGVLMQSFTEWEFRQTSLFFTTHAIIGVVAFVYSHKETLSRIEQPQKPSFQWS